MDFNNFVFPIPPSSYTKNDFKNNIIYIPKKDFSYKDKLKYNIKLSSKLGNKDNKNVSVKPNGKLVYHNKSSSMIQKVPSVTFTLDNKFEESKNKNFLEKNLEYIPCLFFSPENKSDVILLYFHSNYEDIGNSASLLKLICRYLNVNVLAIEYPNYGIYSSKNSANAEAILSDADTVFKFINEVQSISESNIILMGRCIGSGPATYLAKAHNVMALILISPLKSIKEAIKTLFPKLNIGEVIQSIVKERFNNMENISKVTSPILFIHGKKDTLIPPSHSFDLINKCKSPSKLVSPNTMTHNTFDYVQDVIVHIRNFLKVFTNYSINILQRKKENISDNGNNNEMKGISFPLFMFKYPANNNG
jgi:hypothetical protein